MTPSRRARDTAAIWQAPDLTTTQRKLDVVDRDGDGGDRQQRAAARHRLDAIDGDHDGNRVAHRSFIVSHASMPPPTGVPKCGSKPHLRIVACQRGPWSSVSLRVLRWQ